MREHSAEKIVLHGLGIGAAVAIGIWIVQAGHPVIAFFAFIGIVLFDRYIQENAD
jgi:hypothetical protein